MSRTGLSSGRPKSPTRPERSRGAGAARDAKRELARLSKPHDDFDARRYFRGDVELRFYNVGTDRMRAIAKEIYRSHRDEWSISDALAFADIVIKDPYLEVKAVGIEVLALYRRDFTPRLLPAWKRWLAGGYSSNWATTDAICGSLIGPLILRYSELAARMPSWARDRSMWVRRASIVGLIPRARRGESLDLVYEIATLLHSDSEDLIQKAVGWALREAGKADAPRLERYLLTNGPSIPRTTLRYAIERMPEGARREMLVFTRAKGKGKS